MDLTRAAPTHHVGFRLLHISCFFGEEGQENHEYHFFWIQSVMSQTALPRLLLELLGAREIGIPDCVPDFGPKKLSQKFVCFRVDLCQSVCNVRL